LGGSGETVKSLCEYVVRWIVCSQWMRFVLVVASKGEEVCNNIVFSFEVLGGETVFAL
jgi:hypothetical protein